jgi:biopolymer transport protein ExbB/TolQ
MITWFKSLSTVWKIVVLAGVLVAAVLVYDAFTGGLSDVKSWWNNKQYEQTMAQVQKLEDENKLLRAEKAEYEKQAADRAAKDAVYENIEKNLDARGKAEIQKLDEALAEQDKIEAITGQPTDAFTRCERTKAKMIALGSKTAPEINCNEINR